MAEQTISAQEFLQHAETQLSRLHAVSQGLERLQADLTILQPGLEQYEKEPRLLALLRSAYDTEAYQVSW